MVAQWGYAKVRARAAHARLAPRMARRALAPGAATACALTDGPRHARARTARSRAQDVVGAVAWETPDGQTGGLMGPRTASAKTNAKLDEEVQKIVQSAYQTCKATLMENRKTLDMLSEMLIDNETVDARELYQLVKDTVPGATVPDLDKLPTSLEEMGEQAAAAAA